MNVRETIEASSQTRLDHNWKLAIIGAGIGGVAMGCALKRAGNSNFIIYEKADSIGGTWRENSYPGVACDIPSHLYSFSFALNPNWTRNCAPGAEIRDYIEGVARHTGLMEHVRFKKEVVKSRYLNGKWQLEFADGEQSTVDILISCTGILHKPKIPKFAGMQDFGGEMFHSARWPRDLDLAGQRIGCIGSGSSSTQIVPALLGPISAIKLFQRTAQWVFPVERASVSAEDQEALRSNPALLGERYDRIMADFEDKLGKLMTGDPLTAQEFRRICEANLGKVKDEVLRHRLTPEYSVNCKRLVMSDTFYQAVESDKFELVSAPIERFEPTGVRTSDGRFHNLDIVVFATGFESDQYCRSLHPVGEHGRTLDEAWEAGVTAFETVALAGFPNLFMIGGPTSSVTSISYIAGAELQASYIVRLVKLLEDCRAIAIAPTLESQAQYIDANRHRAQQTVFLSGCSSWYLDDTGHFQFYAGPPRDYVSMLANGPRLADYRLIGADADPRAMAPRIASSVN